MKNFRPDVDSGKVYCRFSRPICKRPISPRKLQDPIFRVQTALEIFQGRFSTGESASPKVLRPFLLRESALKFFSGHFPVEIGPEIFQDRFPTGNTALKLGEGDWRVANQS